MKILKKYSLIPFLLVFIAASLFVIRPKNDETLNPFPITIGESIAQAVSPSGQGVFVIGGSNCAAAITNPVNGGTWCLSAGPPPNISIFTGGSFQSYIPSNQPADFGFDFIGVPFASSRIKYVVLRTYTIPANFTVSGNAASSLCKATTASTGTTIFNILHNGSIAATATFAGSATTCTFSTQAAITLVAGDTVAVQAPASPDATLADVAITIGAIRN